ncbi:glycosyltransferase family 2 protein [Brevibacterium salitolerans]|uniref:Glycosyltransferase 2-like domain-containing protein n=1 Tax=Brevibacterium salitolerans TaxID=1403566 RepID=A0ABN2X4Z6_9MICO
MSPRRRRSADPSGSRTRLLADGPSPGGEPEGTLPDSMLIEHGAGGHADEDRLRRDAHVLRDAETAESAQAFEVVPSVDGEALPVRGVGKRASTSPAVTEASAGTPYTFGVVVLTQGKRPEDLDRGFRSLLAQRGVELDVICVGNGWEPVGMPDGVRTLALPENLGIPAGRNEGVPHVRGEFLFFLDDDAWLPDDTTLLRMAQMMRAKPEIGLIQPQVTDPSRDDAPLRWIPRLRKGSPEHSSTVFSVWEGAICLQRRAFDESGGWPAPFWYAHEGIELAWRVWDAGYQVWYRGDIQVAHPVIDPKRHDEYFYMNARNRVWLARRNLPFPISWAYVGSWTLVQCLRWAKKPQQLRAWFTGWRDGWRLDPWSADEEQKKLSGRGLLAMTRHGRPPVV